MVSQLFITYVFKIVPICCSYIIAFTDGNNMKLLNMEIIIVTSDGPCGVSTHQLLKLILSQLDTEATCAFDMDYALKFQRNYPTTWNEHYWILICLDSFSENLVDDI